MIVKKLHLLCVFMAEYKKENCIKLQNPLLLETIVCIFQMESNDVILFGISR